MLALIRLQWWREVVEGAGETARNRHAAARGAGRGLFDARGSGRADRGARGGGGAGIRRRSRRFSAYARGTAGGWPASPANF